MGLYKCILFQLIAYYDILSSFLLSLLSYNITIADDFSRGKRDEYLNSLIKKRNIKVISSDFTDSSSFDKLDTDYDYVYMLASVVGVEYTQKVPNEIIRINTALIFNTLEWIKKSDCKKILFTSTSECYAGSIEAFNYKEHMARGTAFKQRTKCAWRKAEEGNVFKAIIRKACQQENVYTEHGYVRPDHMKGR